MNNSSERKLKYVKGEGGLYLSCNTETSPPSLALNQKPYPWEVTGFKNNEETSSGTIMTHTGNYPALFVQPDSFNFAPDKGYCDAVLSYKNVAAMKFILTHTPANNSVTIYLVGSAENGKLFLGKNKNSDALVFSLNETTWQVQEA